MRFTTKCNNASKILLFSLLQLYNIIIGTLLTVFVPQKCGDHSCSIVEIVDIHNKNTIRNISLLWNCFTFLIFIITYGIEIKRERWCTKYLENNPSNTESDISIILRDSPILEFKIKSLNFYYICCLECSYFIYIINLILSGISVSQNYLDITSITSFIGFVLLITHKLNSSFLIASRSYSDNIAYSAYKKFYMIYNTPKQIYNNDFYSRI